jgi:hypothetical protein
MMKSMIPSVVIAIVAMSMGIRAQSGGTMAKDDKMGKMDGPTKTYTGCVEAGSEAGAFTLTHVMAADHMGKGAMQKDTMKNDAMGKDAMAHDTTMPTTLTLTGKSVDLSKHVGHKVTVTGSAGQDAMEKGMSAFTVKSLKMVASSCS